MTEVILSLCFIKMTAVGIQLIIRMQALLPPKFLTDNAGLFFFFENELQ